MKSPIPEGGVKDRGEGVVQELFSTYAEVHFMYRALHWVLWAQAWERRLQILLLISLGERQTATAEWLHTQLFSGKQSEGDTHDATRHLMEWTDLDDTEWGNFAEAELVLGQRDEADFPKLHLSPWFRLVCMRVCVLGWEGRADRSYVEDVGACGIHLGIRKTILITS